MAQPATTTPRPKYSQEMAIEEFIRQYEFWCACEGHDDEERIARGFVFCFESLLRGTIMRAYENSNTWDQMKQTTRQSTVPAAEATIERKLLQESA